MSQFSYVDLFSGCGGLSAGFHERKSFRQLLAIDKWQQAVDTYQRNFPGAVVYCDDIGSPQARKLLLSHTGGDCDLVVGGPPCQGFSTLGKREVDCEKSALVDVFLDAALRLRPKLIIMENVKGVLSKLHPSGTRYGDHIKKRLSEGRRDRRYVVRAEIVDCGAFGLAQTRSRYLCVAVRADLLNPNAILQKFFAALDSKKSSQRLTLRDAIGDLPNVPCRGGVFEVRLSDGQRIYNHQSLNHSVALEKRFSHVPPGGGLLNVPRRLLTPHLKRMIEGKYGSGGHVKNIYGRLEWDKPSGTIVAGIDKITCGRFVHPDENRLLTPRECARLQGFSDEFAFLGSLVTQYYLIGNAVPPSLSQALAFASEAVLKELVGAVSQPMRAAA